ncbi:hypothetical protein ADK18_07240 [Bacillus anthracis]|nr:hypothetical protein ADK18_07240 [Bacillus anthracis]
MLDAIKMTDMRIPANAIIHVEEMKGGVVLSVEVDGQIIYTMAYDEETDSYAELYDRNDKRACQVHEDFMGWSLLNKKRCQNDIFFNETDRIYKEMKYKDKICNK